MSRKNSALLCLFCGASPCVCDAPQPRPAKAKPAKAKREPAATTAPGRAAGAPQAAKPAPIATAPRPSPYASAQPAAQVESEVERHEGQVSDNVVRAEALSALLRKGMLHRSEVPRAKRMIQEAYPGKLLEGAKEWREKHDRQ